MNEKIGLQDLVVLLAEKANISKKDAETLVKECFDTMEERLIEDKLLKIRNLGTFKLVQVEDRESVDVSTGERVLIPAHYKVTFAPDVDLAEKVNAPYASLETVEIAETGFSGKTEDEPGIDDETDDETDDDDEEKVWSKPEEQKEPAVEIVENEPEEPQVISVEQEEPEIEQPEVEQEEIKAVYEEPINNYSKDEQEEGGQEEQPDYSEQYDEDYRPIEATNGLFWFFFLIASAFILFFAGQYFCPMIGNGGRRPAIPDSVVVFSYSVNKPQVTDSLKAKAQKADSAALKAVGVPKTQPSNAPAEQTPKTQPPASAKTEPAAAAPKTQPAASAPKTEPVTAVKTPAADNQSEKTSSDKTYKVRSGERLNTIALREYGHKAFWVYIYDENRDVIRNPDLIEPGMTIHIPPAAKYGIDKNNRESVDKALELQQRYKPKSAI